MKGKTGIAIVSLTVVAIVALWVVGTSPPTVTTMAPGKSGAKARPSEPDSSGGGEPAEVEGDSGSDAEPSFWPVPEGVLVSDHPEMFKHIPPVTEEWIEANFVLPYVHEQAPSCTNLELPTGAVICWEEYEFHPYLQYEVASLEQIADTDAAAASALSVMFVNIDNDKAFEHAFHASELSGEMGPLYRFIAVVRYDSSSVDDLLEMYALARYMEFRGWDRPQAYNYELALKRLGLTKSEIVAAANERPIDSLNLAKPVGGE